MNAPPKQTLRIVGTVTTEDGRFSIRSPFNPKALSFFQSLPHSKWHKPPVAAWKCDATPLTASMLINVGLSVDDNCKHIAETWDAGQLPAQLGDIAGLLMGFKTIPWKHQQRAMAYAINKPAVLLNMGMGSGKSLTTICLLQAWRSKMVLILCPKSVMGVWRREFHKHCGVSNNVTVLDCGSSKDKAASLYHGKSVANRYAVNAFVVNYESSWREHINDALQSTAWDCVVCDESHRIKEMSSNQSKFAATLTTTSSKRLALTGTVMPRGAPIEALGQYRFLEPALFGTTKTRFQDKFCIMSHSMQGKIDGYKNQEEFMDLFSKIAFRVKSEDVLDLPSMQQITIPVTLDKKTRNYYEQMKKECLLQVESGDITAKNAAIKVMRLHQIACGHSKTEDGIIVRLGTDKKDVLEDLLSDIEESEPVVVFCKFLEDLKQIADVAAKLGRTYGEISGARKDLTPHSTMPEGIQVMGVQSKAGGVGIDLTRARYGVWFSACDTWGDFDQANARIHRPGQTRPVVIYHLAAAATVDVKIYRSLQNQKDVGLELLKSIEHEEVDE